MPSFLSLAHTILDSLIGKLEQSHLLLKKSIQDRGLWYNGKEFLGKMSCGLIFLWIKIKELCPLLTTILDLKMRKLEQGQLPLKKIEDSFP